MLIFDVIPQPAQFPAPILRASVDDGGAEGARSVRKRILGVSWARAFISSHDVNETPERGWSITSWDLSLDPPVVVDSVAVAGEPIDVIIDDERIIVARADGLTVVSPPCGP